MSRESHPAFYEPCCEPFVKLTPSGNTQRFHSFRCKVSPNVQINRKPLPRPDLRALHDYNSCGVVPCLTCDYIAEHMDDEDDRRTG